MASNYIPNPITNIGMDDFLAVSDSHEGLAKSARYAVRILPAGNLLNILNSNGIMRDLTYLCEATEFPGRGLQTVDVRYYGPTFKMPFVTQYEDINMTFLCRTESYEREFFDSWMSTINPVDTYDFSYRSEYNANIDIFQFSDTPDETGNNPKAQYYFSILDAFPVLVNPQPVTWADDQFLRLSVSFTYRRWKRPGIDQESRGGDANASFLLVPGIPA
jgi:hypothetical protein